MEQTLNEIFDRAESDWTEAEKLAAPKLRAAAEAQFAAIGLAVALKNARKESGHSQQTLAKLTGIAQTEISRIEKARVAPRLNTLLTLAAALNLEFSLVKKAS